jgi:hypothetical protein
MWGEKIVITFLIIRFLSNKISSVYHVPWVLFDVLNPYNSFMGTFVTPTS